VTNTGNSAAASGPISNSGAVGVAGSTPTAGLRAAATLNLAAVLPPGVASARLAIGAVAASSQCRVSALRIGLLDRAAAGSELASVTLGAASAGANGRLP
jgi:hypothetical protein